MTKLDLRNDMDEVKTKVALSIVKPSKIFLVSAASGILPQSPKLAASCIPKSDHPSSHFI